MHSSVVEVQSPALNAFVNNTNFKEAGDRHATLEDVDEDTFISFIQYAYTGTFEVAGMAKGRNSVQAAKPDALMAEPPDDYGWGGYDARPARYKVARRRRPGVWETFTTAVSQACPPGYKPPTETVTITPDDDVADILIRYTRLYLFADCYGISRLMGLSLYSLGQTLMALDLKADKGDNEDRVEDVVALLQFCYNGDPTPDQLKSLILRYVACNAERLWKNTEFQKLLAAHAELGAALVGLLVERLD
ncbi:hypothetical protein B0I37DRAFT_392962 [Chaetomium sp. MPI-CAGE-AT-0009]|nr:hypothetical protein B0I37DRAFT_392962 [Chaetomium sp. MPI-CAGE-AT-0009]